MTFWLEYTIKFIAYFNVLNVCESGFYHFLQQLIHLWVHILLSLCGRPRRCPHLNSRTSEHFPFYSKMDFIDVVKAIEKQKLFWFM